MEGSRHRRKSGVLESLTQLSGARAVLKRRQVAKETPKMKVGVQNTSYFISTMANAYIAQPRLCTYELAFQWQLAAFSPSLVPTNANWMSWLSFR